MGWKASAIFIKPAGNVDDQKLLDLFGYGDAQAEAKPGYLETAIYPAENYLYIARFNDVIVICVQDFPDRFYTQQLTYIEQRLADIFPVGEILAISLHSGNNYFGYALIKDGKKARVKTGPGHNKAVLFEMGAPLPEEASLYALSKTDSRNEKFFYFEHRPNDPLPEDAVGENFVFNITGRFFGEPMNRSEKFHQIPAQGYRKEKEEKDELFENIQAGKKAAPFLMKNKFLIALVLLLLYYLIRYFVFNK
jgi:hypothetical protein